MWDIEPAQKPWAVGDIVPAGTVVGAEWFGERTDGETVLIRVLVKAGGSSTFDRKILWLDAGPGLDDSTPTN